MATAVSKEGENNEAINGLTEILNKMNQGDVTALARQVTDNVLKRYPDNKEENIALIIQYTPKIEKVLWRKLVTKDLLFRYIHENNIQISHSQPMSAFTKDSLIDCIREHWNRKTNSEVANSERLMSDQMTKQSQNNSSTVNVVENFPLQEFSIKFVGWFLEMFNRDEPIGCEHFWTDCHVQLFLFSPLNEERVEASGDTDVASILYSTKLRYNFILNPNLTAEGVKGKLDPHGLTTVCCCGTIHAGANIVGVFEQAFFLARDPLCENNWKIKKMFLNLRSAQVLRVPAIMDSEALVNMLS